MPVHLTALLDPWTNFYVTTGTSSASLIGLMFVVITLVNSRERASSDEATATFNTPTVVHFSNVLLISALLNVPWRSLIQLSVILAAVSVFGVVYVFRVAHRMTSISVYSADTEDWVWHTVLPSLAYGAIFVSAVILPVFPVQALFGCAAGVITLIFSGIHNAWDIVVYVAIKAPDEPKADADRPQ